MEHNPCPYGHRPTLLPERLSATNMAHYMCEEETTSHEGLHTLINVGCENKK